MTVRAGAVRAIGFFVVWTVLSHGGASDIAAGIVAAVAAAWASLVLLAPSTGRLRVLPAIEYMVRFLRQSAIAGADVARRALDPRLPLRPGFVHYRTTLPRGMARDRFTTLTSLMPGTVPIGPDRNGALLIHCLDLGRPVAAELAAEEAALLRVTGGATHDG